MKDKNIGLEEYQKMGSFFDNDFTSGEEGKLPDPVKAKKDSITNKVLSIFGGLFVYFPFAGVASGIVPFAFLVATGYLISILTLNALDKRYKPKTMQRLAAKTIFFLALGAVSMIMLGAVWNSVN